MHPAAPFPQSITTFSFLLPLIFILSTTSLMYESLISILDIIPALSDLFLFSLISLYISMPETGLSFFTYFIPL